MNWTVSSGVVGNVVRGVGVWYKVSIRLETFHQVSAMTTPATTRVGLCPPLYADDVIVFLGGEMICCFNFIISQ